VQCSLGKILKGLSLVSKEADTARLDLASLLKISGLEKNSGQPDNLRPLPTVLLLFIL
jgi:hypothetical protein